MSSTITSQANSALDIYTNRTESKSETISVSRQAESPANDDNNQVQETEQEFEKKLDQQQQDQDFDQSSEPSSQSEHIEPAVTVAVQIQNTDPVLLQLAEQSETDESLLQNLQNLPLFPTADQENDADASDPAIIDHLLATNENNSEALQPILTEQASSNEEQTTAAGPIVTQSSITTSRNNEEQHHKNQTMATVNDRFDGQVQVEVRQQFQGQQQEQGEEATPAPLQHVQNSGDGIIMEEEVEGLRPLGGLGKTQIASKGPVVTPMPVIQAETPLDKAMASQVSRATLQQISDGQRSLTLRLTPPELGTVKIEIVQSNAGMQVKLSAEDDGVRASLERALPSLRQELRDTSTVREVQVADQHLDFNKDQQQQQQARKENNEPDQEQHGPRFSLDGDMQLPEQVELEMKPDYDRPAYINTDAVNISA